MSNNNNININININNNYQVVVRRGAAGREPFIWEIQHNDTAHVLRSSGKRFANMEEAHRSGLLALHTSGLSNAVTGRCAQLRRESTAI